MREFTVTLLLGFFIGLTIGYYFAGKEARSYYQTVYQTEVTRLQNWNDMLIKTFAEQLKRGK